MSVERLRPETSIGGNGSSDNLQKIVLGGKTYYFEVVPSEKPPAHHEPEQVDGTGHGPGIDTQIGPDAYNQSS